MNEAQICCASHSKILEIDEYCSVGQQLAKLGWNFDFSSRFYIHEDVDRLDGRAKYQLFIVNLRFSREGARTQFRNMKVNSSSSARMKRAEVFSFRLSDGNRDVFRQEPFSVFNAKVIGNEGLIGLMMPAINIGEEGNACRIRFRELDAPRNRKQRSRSAWRIRGVHLLWIS